MINLNVFCSRWVGKKINYDKNPAFYGQCTQLVKQWAKENGWSIPNGGGYNSYGYKNYRNGYYWVQNTLYAVPKPGSILVFKNGPYYKKNGKWWPYGHVAIALPSNWVNLKSFDQNWPLGSPCNFVTHIFYRHIVGWLVWSR